MKLIFRLAWRNIWRNPRRTTLTALAIALSAGVLVFFVSLQESSYSASINAVIKVFYGHLQVQNSEYHDTPQIRDSIPEVQALRSRLEKLSGVLAASSRAYGFALASSKERTYGIQVIGVEPEREGETSTVPGVIRKGRYLQPWKYEAVVGSTLAKNLRMGLGEEISLLGQGRDGSLAAVVVPVVGIFESGERSLDRSSVQVPLSVFQEEFSMDAHGHAIVLFTAGVDEVAELQKVVNRELQRNANHSLRAYRWDELVPGIKEAIELDMIGGWFFFGSLLIIVFFTILNTLLMSVLERRREFGMLLSLGVTPDKLAQILFVEMTLLSFFGIFIGVAIGALIVVYFGVHGFVIEGSEEIMAQWNLPTAIFPKLSVYSLSVGPGVVFLSALLSFVYPLVQLLNLKALPALQGRRG